MRAEKQFLSNDMTTASVHRFVVQGLKGFSSAHIDGRQSSTDINGSQAVAIVAAANITETMCNVIGQRYRSVAMHVSETCETSLDNGNRDLLKLMPQETDQSKHQQILSLH